MSDNIIETLQAVQNERFAQGDSAPKCGNAIFNDEVTVKAIERELEAKRKEWRDLSGRAKSVSDSIRKLESMRNRSVKDEEQLLRSRSFVQTSVTRMKELEKEANDLKSMSEAAQIQWTMQKRLEATIKKYHSISLKHDRAGKEVASNMRNTNFIDERQLQRMPRKQVEWLVAEAEAVRPLLQQLEQDFVAAERLYKEMKPQHDELNRAELKRGGGTLPRIVRPDLSHLARQMADISRSQVNMGITRRAYRHIIEQGKRAKKVLDSLPRETSVRNSSAMAAFQ